MSASTPKEYEHVELSFNKPSGRRNGKHYEVAAFLLVPVEIMPEVTKAHENNAITPDLYDSLLAKGALLHREGGPAYKEVEKSAFDRNHAQVITEQYWEKGARKQPGAHVKKL